MSGTAQYFARRDADGRIREFARIRRTDTGLYPEAFRDGSWQTDGSVMAYMFDRDPRDELTGDQAAAVARELGAPLQ